MNSPEHSRRSSVLGSSWKYQVSSSFFHRQNHISLLSFSPKDNEKSDMYENNGAILNQHTVLQNEDINTHRNSEKFSFYYFQNAANLTTHGLGKVTTVRDVSQFGRRSLAGKKGPGKQKTFNTKMVFPKKERTPLGFCDGLDKIFVGFGDKDERGCRAPKYHTNYAPFYPIHKAASTGNTDTLKTFIKQGVFFMEQVDWKCRTALHFACVYGRPEVVALLMENSCDISPKDIKGATPLIKAVQCRQTKCLDILLKYGAGPDLKDCCDNTALHYAVYNGDVETAAKLLEHQANTEVRNENKLTPLLLALKQNKEKMAEFLINNGANIKPCDFLGRSTLMYAVRCESELIIKLLLQRGIDPSKQDVFGWTAERYAVESKSKVIYIVKHTTFTKYLASNPIQPRTKKKKASTDEVEVIMLKSFKSDLLLSISISISSISSSSSSIDLSLEVVIEESLEEEQKGDDDDDNDDDGNGIAHPQHLDALSTRPFVLSLTAFSVFRIMMKNGSGIFPNLCLENIPPRVPGETLHLVVSEPLLLKEDAVHFAGIPGQERENTATMEMK
ncbi:hypothetical protein STEG23_032759, partial [Scotinomys teguina]